MDAAAILDCLLTHKINVVGDWSRSTIDLSYRFEYQG